ncbi:MAG: RNase H-like domain-containing protein, partial [Candidatus Paceibacterota bacterium]
CHIGFTKIRVLGHIISKNRIEIDPNKFPQLDSFEIPRTGKAIEAFLGFCNYFRAHIPNFARIAAPLEAVRKQRKFELTPNLVTAFNVLKSVLKSNIPLAMPDYNSPMYLATDASTRGLGAVLFQIEGSSRNYIAIISRALSKAEKNYSVTSLELQAICWALNRLHEYLFGRKFQILTDHRSIVTMLNTPIPNNHVQRNLETLLSHNFEITYIPGLDNVLPDLLSRLYDQLKEETDATSSQSTSTTSNQETEPITHPLQDELLLNDLQNPFQHLRKTTQEILGKRLPEKEERSTLLISAHDAHHGPQAMFRKLLLQQQVYWPEMLSDAEELCSKCEACQLYTIKRVGYHPLSSVQSTFPFDSISIDLFGPLPTTPRGNNYGLVCVDDCSSFTILRSIPDKSALSIARELWSIYTTFGIPKVVRSDRGTEFVNSLTTTLHNLVGTNHRVTAPYHPRANGKAEATVKMAKAALFRACHHSFSDWDLFLPATQLALNQRIPNRTLTAPFTVFFGRPFNPFADFRTATEALSSVDDWINHLSTFHRQTLGAINSRAADHDAQVRERFNETHVIAEPHPVGALVMKLVPGLHSKMAPNWEGPFKVAAISKSGSYVLQRADGQNLTAKIPHDHTRLIALPESVPSTLPFQRFESGYRRPTRPNSHQIRTTQRPILPTPMTSNPFPRPQSSPIHLAPSSHPHGAYITRTTLHPSAPSESPVFSSQRPGPQRSRRGSCVFRPMPTPRSSFPSPP